LVSQGFRHYFSEIEARLYLTAISGPTMLVYL